MFKTITFLFLLPLSIASASENFKELCVSPPSDEIRNTVEILLEAAGLFPIHDPEFCERGRQILESKTSLSIGATRYTQGDFEHRALNPLTTLIPLNYFPNLKSVTLRVGHVDLSILGTMSLESLTLAPEDLGFNDQPDSLDLTPIEKIGSLVELKIIGLNLNQKVQIAPLAQLRHLSKLVLSTNLREIDLHPLKALSELKVLDVRSTHLKSLKEISTLTGLESLDVGGNELRDIADLATLVNLTSLRLDFNKLKSVDGVRALKNLKTLHLKLNDLERIDAVSGLSELTTLSINHNPRLSNLSGIEGLSKLEVLEAQYSNISNISPLSHLINLREAYLFHNKIEDLSPLHNLKKLALLNLSENQIQSVLPLGGLTSLKDLNLTLNPIKDLSGLENLGVSTLSLTGLPITDLSIVGKMKTLTSLSLTGTLIKDLDDLLDLKDMEVLFAIDTQACDFKVLDPLVQKHLNSKGKEIALRILGGPHPRVCLP